MKGKVIAFNSDENNLIRLAAKYSDEKNYYAALRMVHKKINLYGAEPDDWLFLAEICDEMDMYETSINYWFRYLAVCDEEDIADAYEGLAVCYYNIGNEPQSAYYYNKLLTVDKDIPPEGKMEIANMFARSAKDMYKIVYPPEKADYSDDIDVGVKLLREHRYEDAKARLKRVHPASKQAPLAKNYLAVCHLVTGNSDDAEKECLEILEKNPNDVQAFATYCATLVEKQETAKSKQVAKKLCSISTENPDELYKIATVCCESGLHAEAYEKFSILENFVKYDITLLFFKAVAAFKSEQYDKSLKEMAKILNLFPNAEVVRYYYNELRSYIEGEGELPSDINYFYKIPQRERERRIKFLAVILEIRADDLKAYVKEFDLKPLLRWCFDEFDGQEPELQLLAIKIAIKADIKDFIEEILLDSTVNDVMKIELLQRIFERNKETEISVVLCDIFKSINFYRLYIGRAKNKIFVSAYSECVIKYCILGDDECAEYNVQVGTIYRLLEKNDKLHLISDQDTLACVIRLSICDKIDAEFDETVKLFHANPETVKDILKVLDEGENINEID